MYDDDARQKDYDDFENGDIPGICLGDLVARTESPCFVPVEMIVMDEAGNVRFQRNGNIAHGTEAAKKKYGPTAFMSCGKDDDGACCHALCPFMAYGRPIQYAEIDRAILRKGHKYALAIFCRSKVVLYATNKFYDMQERTKLQQDVPVDGIRTISMPKSSEGGS